MRKILLIAFLGCLLLSCSSTNQHFTHLDVENEEISRSKFKRHISTRKYLEVRDDSLNQKKLIQRHETGEVRGLESLHSKLAAYKNPGEIDFSKPVTIIYYPGKDPCNSSATTDKNHLKNSNSLLEQGIVQNNSNPPFYIYKEKEGLEKYNGIIEWQKDTDQFIEKMFFQHHYPCSSFVVISPQGKYIAYYGEFAHKYVWNALVLLN